MAGDAQIPNPRRRFELLGNRNFVLLWCAYGISAMGDHISEMAILKTQNVLDKAKDVTPLNARMTFMFFVPFFLLGPIAGVLADRLPRRLVMISADVIRCGLMLGFGGLIAWTQGWGSWGPFAPLLLVGVFAALFSPARSALVPTLIQPNQLVRANGLIAGLGIIATMTANLIGGYLAAHHHPEIAFRVDAGTFLASAVLLAFIVPPQQHGNERGDHGLASAFREVSAGFRYAKCHRHVLELLAVAAVVWFCGSLVNSVIPAVVRDVYDRGYQAMSGFRAFLGMGFIIGAVVIATLGDALRSEVAISWGLLGVGVSAALFSASVFLPLDHGALYAIGALATVGAGMFGVSVMASTSALLQRIVPDRYRGRVFGVSDLVTTGALLTATGLLGVPHWSRLDQWVGYILLGVAVMTFTTGIITLWVRLRGMNEDIRYSFACSANEFVAKFWWRLQRVGPATVPREGPVIVTANHTCSADPLFLYAAVRHRMLSFMVAAEYATWPVFGTFIRLAKCIPVKRDSRDTGATKQAIRYLREGRGMGIFIEGRIVPPGEVGQPKDGVAMLALKTGAAVVPAHISGVARGSNVLKGLFSRHRARVRFGPPIDLSEFRLEKPDRETIRAATQKIYDAVQRLAPRETRVDALDDPAPSANSDFE